MKKIILILVGLALCLTVAAQEKAKTTNVQGYALAIDNAFYSFKESTKAFTDQNSRRGFDMQFFFTQKAGYPIMGISQHCWNRYDFYRPKYEDRKGIFGQ